MFLKVKGVKFTIIFNLFSRIKKFIREHKLKTDRFPKVEGGQFWVIFNLISRIKKIIQENKLKMDRVPKVEGDNFESFLICFPEWKIYSGKQIKNGPSSKSRGVTILSHFYRGADIASPPTDSIFHIPGLGVALSLSKHVPGFRRPKF